MSSGPFKAHDQYSYGFADVLKIIETPRQCFMPMMHGGAMQPGDASGDAAPRHAGGLPSARADTRQGRRLRRRVPPAAGSDTRPSRAPSYPPSARTSACPSARTTTCPPASSLRPSHPPLICMRRPRRAVPLFVRRATLPLVRCGACARTRQRTARC